MCLNLNLISFHFLQKKKILKTDPFEIRIFIISHSHPINKLINALISKKKLFISRRVYRRIHSTKRNNKKKTAAQEMNFIVSFRCPQCL